MNLGYSLLLGEHIEANAIEYQDCKQFQIVCPACKEPVFKCARSQELHYLSHYEKSKAYVAECELRIKGTTGEQIKQADSLSRDQRLKYFLSIFKEMLFQARFAGTPTEARTVTLLKQIQKSKALKAFKAALYDRAKANMKTNPEVVTDSLNYWIDEYNDFSDAPLTTAFSMSVQKRIASDFWGYILSSKATENFDYLFCANYLIKMSRIELSQEVRTIETWERELFTNMQKLMQTSFNKGMQLLNNMNSIPVPSEYHGQISMLDKMGYELLHEMIGGLIVLPYFDYLKKARP